MKNSLSILAVLALLPTLQGCVAAVAAAAVAGVGYVQYERNELTYELPLPFERAHEAAVSALNELGYARERVEEITSTESVLEVDDVWVRVEQLPAGESRLRVRVGTFHTADHQRRARLVVEETYRDLGMDPPVFEEGDEEPQVADPGATDSGSEAGAE